MASNCSFQSHEGVFVRHKSISIIILVVTWPEAYLAQTAAI